MNESPLVSVGAEGGLWFAHPTRRRAMSLTPTLLEKASPHVVALQFEVYFAGPSRAKRGRQTDADAPRVN